METFEAISRRASCREYQNKAVPKDMLGKLVDAGRRAPTARAVEPWEFVVVTRNETLKQLGEIATTGAFIANAAACIAVFCRKEAKYYLEDGSAATENILLAATDLGLGTCWVAGDKKPYVPRVARLLKVPETLTLVSLISVGWPKGEVNQAKHRSLSEVLHWEELAS